LLDDQLKELTKTTEKAKPASSMVVKIVSNGAVSSSTHQQGHTKSSRRVKLNENPSIGETSIGIASLSACNSVDQVDFILENTSLDNVDAVSTKNTASVAACNNRKESYDMMDRSDRDSTSTKAIASICSVKVAGGQKKVSMDKNGLLSAADMEECSVSFVSEKSVNPSVTALAGSLKYTFNYL
jgi:hypothetical protein